MPKPDLAGVDVADLVAGLVPGHRRLYPMAEGLQCRVYGIDGATQHYVLRIGADRAGFDKDAYAAAAFAGPRLPIPHVLAIGEVADHAYCLSRRLPGTPVNRIATDALAVVVEAVDAALHVLWTQDVSRSTGYGMFDNSGDAAFVTWRDYLLDPTPVQAAVDRPGVPPRLAEGLHAYVAARADDCPEDRSLLHGDFGADNVLTDGHTVTGVLDWELAGYGDQMHDVAEILQWEGGGACVTAQARYLRQTLPADPGTWRRIDCYRARICLDELAYGPPETLHWMTAAASSITQRPA